jgi:hypothetical protein
MTLAPSQFAVYLIQILLPLYDNGNRRIPQRLFTEAAAVLSERFGGLTAYTRAPAEGLWRRHGKQTARDDIVIYEVMSRNLERGWWRKYRGALEDRFRQEQIVIRAQQCHEL